MATSSAVPLFADEATAISAKASASAATAAPSARDDGIYDGEMMKLEILVKKLWYNTKFLERKIARRKLKCRRPLKTNV